MINLAFFGDLRSDYLRVGNSSARFPLINSGQSKGRIMHIHITQDELNDIVGQNIVFFRKAHRLEKQMVADALDINMDIYNKIEAGEVTVPLIYMYYFADFFNVTIDELCYLKGTTLPAPTPDIDDPNIHEKSLNMSSDEKTAILSARYWNIPIYETVLDIIKLRIEHDMFEDEYFPAHHRIKEVPLSECFDPESDGDLNRQ